MKIQFYIIIAFLLFGCNATTIKINGTAKGMDGGFLSVLDLKDKIIYSSVIQSGKFLIKEQPLPASGYYTLSAFAGPYPRDFEIYLEPGTYTIDIPEKETDYLKINTTSKTQNKLSAYYNFENYVMAKFRREDAMWESKLNDPKIKDIPEAELQNIMDHIATARRREGGLHLNVMDMFIKKYPQNDIVPHIMINMSYQKDPQAYYMLYKKLSHEVKNTKEGKIVGEELERLLNSH
jgi:hypothetical protein